MKSILLSVLILLAGLVAANGQSSMSSQPDKQTVKQLAATCKVWGLLKYYHPAFSSGGLNCDSFLVHGLITGSKAKGQKEFEALLLKKIQSLQQGSFTKNNQPVDSLKTFINWNWITTEVQHKQLRDLLQSLRSFSPDSVATVSFKTRSGISLDWPRFIEKTYDSLQYPDEAHRYLALFRAWNIIQYYFPYKNLMDKHWDEVLLQFIPRFAAAKDTVQYHLACKELMKYLDDGHSFASSRVINTHFGRRTVPFELSYVEGKFAIANVLNDSLFKLSGLQLGDVIVAIGDQKIEDRKQYLAKYFGGSNRRAIDGKEIADRIFVSNDSISMVTISRQGKQMKIPVTRYGLNIIFSKPASVPVWSFPEPSIAYVHMGRLTNPDTLKHLFAAVANTKGLILDFRHYPNFMVMYPFLSHLYETNKPFAKFLVPLKNKPGYFRDSYEGFMFQDKQDKLYTGKIILLVNERSGSLGEFFPMALQVLDRTVTIGSQTWGGDGNQIGVVLPAGINIGFSGLGIFYPDGGVCQRKGIRVDRIVYPTIKGLREGRDELLEYAINYLRR
ncbi:MAG TPA: S41 family peptidase [Chitinophagaceae bacterium]|nr:S41 family peptidase [Chitinophagaceae bacterium]